MDIRVIHEEDITEIEDLRINVFNIGFKSNGYYSYKYSRGELIIIGAYINDELVGATYISPYRYDYGYIEQVFVKKEYQNSDYHVGTALLKYIEAHAKDISDYFAIRSKFCFIKKLYIEYIDEISHRVYANAGFKSSVQPDVMYKSLDI